MQPRWLRRRSEAARPDNRSVLARVPMDRALSGPDSLRLLDPAAGGDVLLVVLEQRVRELEHLQHTLVCDPIEDDPMLPPRLDEATPAQTGEMVRDLRLWHPQPLHQLADREFPLVAQQLEDPQSRRLAQPPEVLRDQIRLDRRLRQPERRFKLRHRPYPHIRRKRYQN